MPAGLYNKNRRALLYGGQPKLNWSNYVDRSGAFRAVNTHM